MSGPKLQRGIYLDSGSRLVNCAITGRHDLGYLAGSYVLFIGDSQSGKTWFTLAALAEASIDPRFKDYRLIYDNSERGARMDLMHYFGEKLKKRIEPPRRAKKGVPVYSYYLEDMYYHLDDALSAGIPFIYVADSLDVLSSRSEEKKFDEQKKAARADEKAKGDYGDGKAKISSRHLRRMISRIEESGSIFFLINQTRDDPSAGPFESSKTHSGGKAISFYAHTILWSEVAGRIKSRVRGKDRDLGPIVRVRVLKNRSTGRWRWVKVPLPTSHGIDDVGSCVDFLCDEKGWKRNKQGVITATGLGPTVELKREELCRHIEELDAHEELAMMTEDLWEKIEEECRKKIQRRSRYE